MKFSSQSLQAEREYNEAYLRFKTACCLDWDNEEELEKAYQCSFIILNHLKALYPDLYRVYNFYKNKIIGLHNSSVLFLWNERNKNYGRN